MNEDWTIDEPDTDDLCVPRLGDVIACSDGDIGICLRSYWGGSDGARLMVEVVWSQAGKTLTDPWDVSDGYWRDSLFQIVSRA